MVEVPEEPWSSRVLAIRSPSEETKRPTICDESATIERHRMKWVDSWQIVGLLTGCQLHHVTVRLHPGHVHSLGNGGAQSR